jgi:dTDP-4-amino-4,6-dideoxygalactose transaminase
MKKRQTFVRYVAFVECARLKKRRTLKKGNSALGTHAFFFLCLQTKKKKKRDECLKELRVRAKVTWRIRETEKRRREPVKTEQSHSNTLPVPVTARLHHSALSRWLRSLVDETKTSDFLPSAWHVIFP